MTGARLLPVGTVYDPFVNRGLDVFIYACYQDARFLLVGHAVGTDAGAGGWTASIGQHAADRHGGRPAGELRAGACRRVGDFVVLRLRSYAARRRICRCGYVCRHAQLEQPWRVRLDKDAVIAGAHWVVPPTPGCTHRDRLPGSGGAGGSRLPLPNWQTEEPGAVLARRNQPGQAACWLACRVACKACRVIADAVSVYRARAGAARTRVRRL